MRAAETARSRSPASTRCSRMRTCSKMRRYALMSHTSMLRLFRHMARPCKTRANNPRRASKVVTVPDVAHPDFLIARVAQIPRYRPRTPDSDVTWAAPDA